MISPRIATVAATVLACAGLIHTSSIPSTTAHDEPRFPFQPQEFKGKKNRIVAITLTSDSTIIRAGDSNVFTHTVPDTFKMSVVSLRFEMTVLGKINTENGAMILFDRDETYPAAPEMQDEKGRKDFDGFAISAISPARDQFPINQKGESQSLFTENGVKGVRTKVKALNPGNYLFTAVWRQKDPGPVLVSVPVVLRVDPKPK